MLLCAATVSLPGDGHAQRFWAGARLGAASSNLDYDVETSSRTGIAAFAVFGAQFTRLLAVEPAIGYVAKGATGGSEEDEFTIALRYLELQVPLVLAVPIPDSPFRPRVYTGLAAALELGCDVEFEVSGVMGTTDCGLQDEPGLIAFTVTTPIDLGWLIGGGIDATVGPGAFTLDVRYNLGLSDISDLPGSIENRSLQLLAGYVVFFGGPYTPPHRFPVTRG